MDNFKLINNFVLVKPVSLDSKIKSVLLSENDRKPKSNGIVIKTSKNIKVVKNLDEIFYYKHSGIKASISGENYVVLDENEILCIKRRGMFFMVNDRVLIRENESIKNIDNIILSVTDAKERTSGKVLSVSNSVDDINVDDDVMFSKYSGVYIMIEDEQLKVLDKKEIFIIL